MSELVAQLREKATFTRQLIAGHVRYCEECEDSVKEDRKANCVVGYNLVVAVVKLDRAIEMVEKVERDGARITEVVFNAEGFLLKGDMA